MISAKPVLFLVLAYVLLSSLPGHAQDTQEAFQQQLLAASYAEDKHLIQQLIQEHRLWVKPVVDDEITSYLQERLRGNTPTSDKKLSTISLIGNTFQEVYDERCLAIGVAYLSSWDESDVKKKIRTDSLNGKAKELRTQMDLLDKAIDVYYQVISGYAEIGDERGLADAYGGMGYVYWFLNPDSCKKYYLKALETRQKVDDRALTASSLNGLGSLYYRQLNDLDQAVDYYLKAAHLREEIGDWYALGNTLAFLANVYEELGEIDEANKTFLFSYEINQKSGNLVKQAESLYHLGGNFKDLNKNTEALAYLLNAKDLYTELEYPIGIADVYIQMALIHIQVGDYETAIKEALEADRLFSESDDVWGLAGAYNNIGIILQEADRQEKALEYFSKALEIYEELDDMDNYRRVLNNLGTLNYDLQKYSESEELQQKSLDISRDMEYKHAETTSLLNLANTQNRLGKFEEALSNYELALAIAKDIGIPEIEWKVMVGIGENYKLQGDYQRAIKYNDLGLNIVEQMRQDLRKTSDRSTYMARERYAFEEVIHMLGELHQKEPNEGYDLKAFEYAQRSKSRSFLDQVTNSEMENLTLVAQAPISSIKEIQHSALDNKTVFLEYSLGDSCSYVWIITKKNHLMLPLPGRSELRNQIEPFRFALLNPTQDNIEFLAESGYLLFEKLIKPAELFFRPNSTLIIFPDGVLNYIPFEVLICNQPTDQVTAYTALPYLTLKYPISYGQSASIMKILAEQKVSDKPLHPAPRLLAFGDPVYEESPVALSDSNSAYNRLIYSGEEIARIGSYFREGGAKLYVREKATEEIVKTPGLFRNTSHIHFATHGLVNEKEPSLSSLVLSQQHHDSEDGYLQVKEIAELEMDADLVVLSACETGLGKMIRGEGIIGLSRAFMYAGTPSVVMSLWSVSDQSTSILMDRFYENLIGKNISKTEALNQARISMIREEKYTHPFFWAPFVLNGYWK